MVLTIDELLKGKATKIKNKEYFSTEQYITPFLEKMSKFTDNFLVQAKLPDQISYTQDGEINTDDLVYNRVWIQAVLPYDIAFDNHKQTVGLVYGLDVRKPVVKLYKGGLNMACTNLCVFSPEYLNIQELAPETPIDYRPVKYIMDQTLDIANTLKKLQSIEIPYIEQDIDENLGHWIREAMKLSYDNGFGKVKIASTLPIDAYKLLYEKKDSPYYVQKGHNCTMFDVYNAMTQVITDDTRDIVNKVEKTLLLKDILSF